MLPEDRRRIPPPLSDVSRYSGGVEQDESLAGLLLELRFAQPEPGPGIRTQVVFKGCSMRCVWCSRPSAQRYRPELEIVSHLCELCGRCQGVCEAGRHLITDEYHLLSKEAECQSCFLCAESCPSGAITMVGRVRTVAEVLALAGEDKASQQATDGGLTLSGGEPLYQADYALALLRGARRRGRHTVLETSGQVEPALLAAACRETDLVRFDLKETEPVLHAAWTGAEYEPVRSNLLLAAREAPGLELRLPVVPGMNDRDDHWHAVGELAGTLAQQPRVLLSPWADLSSEVQPTDEELTRLHEIRGILAEYGLRTRWSSPS